MPLKILIAGAGIGGLAAAIALRKEGHEVHLYEKSAFQRELGAAIQMAPNANGLLRYLGVTPEEHGATLAEHLTYANAVDGTWLVHRDLGMMAKLYPNPWQFMHRVELHSALKSAAVSPNGPGIPAVIHLESQVVAIDPARPSLTTANGEVIIGDLVIGADGTHSKARACVLGYASPSRRFGQSCYRFIVPISTIKASPNPGTADLVSITGNMCVWQDAVQRRGVVAYPCRQNTELNVVLFFVDDETTAKEEWNQIITKEQLMKKSEGYHESLVGLMELAKEPRAFQLLDHPALETWTRDKVVLLGDAAHPFLPHQGQGGAQSIEDAVALATMLPKETETGDIPSRLKLYEQCRKERATKIQDETRNAANAMGGNAPAIDLMSFMTYNFGHDARQNALDVLRAAVEG